MTSEESLMPQPVTAPAAGSETRRRFKLSWFSRLTDAQRDEVLAWLDENGFPRGSGVVWFETDVVDAPLVRAAVHELDENGQSFCRPGEVMAATVLVERLQRTSLPEFARVSS